MQELCILCGSHKTRTTPYHMESDGMVERFNRTLLMMLAMFAGKNRDDWDDLLPAVMMAYQSSVHETTRFSPYRLMFGEECTVQITFIFIDFRVCDFAFAFKTQNAPCVSRFKRVLFSDRFQFAF